MKAIVVHDFVRSYDELKVNDTADPILAADEILVAVDYAGINFVDLLYSRGQHQNNVRFVKPPFILGLEFSGKVVSCPSWSRLQAGDCVFGGGLGAFAEKIAVKESNLMPLPKTWSLRQAAAMAATAPVSYGALVRIAKVKMGETVLVHAAAGGLGVMAIQIVKAIGGRVIATIGSQEKEQVVKQLDVEDVINYQVEGWERRVLAATGGIGVDVTFDPVGLVEKSVKCSKYAGRIVVLGFAGREGNLEKIAANRVLLKSITIHGYRYGEHGRQFAGETAAVWSGLSKLIDQGLVKPVLFDQLFEGLDSVPTAMKAMANRKVWGKAVIKIKRSCRKSTRL